jgi:hypothetical protein
MPATIYERRSNSTRATRETVEARGFYNDLRKLILERRVVRIPVFIAPHHRWREGDYKAVVYVHATFAGNEGCTAGNRAESSVLSLAYAMVISLCAEVT